MAFACALLAPGASAQAVNGPAHSGAYTTKYVQLVIFENEGYGRVVGNSQAPYLTGLAKRWANMTDSRAIAHPSQPNYLALFSGSTQGVTGDDCPVNFSAPNLGSELIEAGLSFTGYAESMPRDGFEGCVAQPTRLPSGFLYARKHVPWTDFTRVPKADNVVYRHPLAAPLSRFVWITPDMCNDMHDCSIGRGDRWAARNLPALIAWDEANDGVLVITFDENDGSPVNRIATILIGNVNPGQYSQSIDHYNVLRTIENIFGVEPLGAAASAAPIYGVVR